MPPVKKPPKNPFSFYMDEHIPRLRMEGIVIGHKEKVKEFSDFLYNLEFLTLKLLQGRLKGAKKVAL